MTGDAAADERRQALAHALDDALDEHGRNWLSSAVAAVTADPAELPRLFPVVARSVGRVGLGGDAADPWMWTTDEAGRALLLTALPHELRDGALRELYRYGDRHERSAVLRALDVLAARQPAGELVRDALRTNDPRLVAAALSPTGLAALHEPELVQAVLKCVFMGLDLTRLPLPEQRVTPQLSRALALYALERVTAGRAVPSALWPLVERHPPHDVLAALRRVHDRIDPAEEPVP